MRRCLRPLLLVLAGLVLLELLLQAGAFAVFLSARSGGAKGEGGDGPTLLCLGDSFTYGLGSSTAERTYPAVLQRFLRERLDGAPRVINAGWPSRNSREALALLDGELDLHRPVLVFLLVGLNDMWSRPALLEARAEDPSPSSRWHWRLRTLRLVLWALGSAADGDRAVAGGREEEPAPHPADPAAGGPFEIALQRLAQGDPEGAVEPFERAVGEQPERAVEALQGLVQTHSVLGRPEQAGDALARLEAQWNRVPDQRRAEALATSLAVVGERRRAEQLAREGLERFPTSSSLWWLSAEGHYRDRQLVEAEQAYDRALEYAAPDDPGWRAVLLRCGARASSARDPHKGIRLLVSALMLDRDFARTRIVVETEREHFPPERVDEVLAQLTLNPQELAAVEAVFAEGNPQDASEPCDILAEHLRRMIDLCRARGARPVLLTYPMLEAEIEEVQVTVARAASVPLIRVRERFDEELLRRSRDELFIPDGHCSDAGYALMGELAAEAALELIGR